MTAEILSIGDELLIGQVVNTNQAFIAQQLNAAGVVVDRMSTVGDDRGEILDAFGRAMDGHDIVTVTGGLGPTHDDITRDVVCEFFGTTLEHHPPTLENIRSLFERRGQPFAKINEGQAMIPRGCTVIPNRLGTAPGFMLSKGSGTMFVMPGVPYEMHAMVRETVLPWIAARNPGQVVRHRTIKTTGIAESLLAELLAPIESIIPTGQGMTLAFLPSPLGVRLRITAVAPDERTASEQIGRAEATIRSKASKYIYGVDEEEIEDILCKIMTERGLTLAVAESCTGGSIVDRLTNVPGSSAYVERGFVTYSNASKVQNLGVPESLIEAHGAVSGEVARSMAEGARRAAGTSIGLSTTGIAGPTGGSAEKPVGLVYVGYADKDGSLAVRFSFGEGRRRVKDRATQAALELLRRKLLSLA